jgi:hypothetical protein
MKECADKDIKNQLFNAYKEAEKGLGFVFEDSVVPVTIINHRGQDAQVQVKVTLVQDDFIGE